MEDKIMGLLLLVGAIAMLLLGRWKGAQFPKIELWLSGAATVVALMLLFGWLG